ncbi:mitochondrial carrier [Rickenella mellea]|uniref:Mitochondrial carrier n=1 Tax=Rickenella mellea TaxID=50990 RepID=A0A4R5XH51_9AGAM|nr:mitochondrial carrier [Rickenella mellea]
MVLPVGSEGENVSGHEIYDATLAGAQDRPFIPRLKSDPSPFHPLPRSLEDYKRQEGAEAREERLRKLWEKLPAMQSMVEQKSNAPPQSTDQASLTPERAKTLTSIYRDELVHRCAGAPVDEKKSTTVKWDEFKRYADSKEVELWHIFHDELDLDGNGHLDANELTLALQRAGIVLSPTTLSDFMTFLTSSPHSHAISFPEFRDFLLLLPRKVSTAEIYRYYEVRKYLGDDGRGAARVTMEGDVSLSAEDKPPTRTSVQRPVTAMASPPIDHTSSEEHEEAFEDEHEDEHHFQSLKFLLAGGIAGAVSRTSTAPFDRLKIFLITRSPELSGASLGNVVGSPQAAARGLNAIMGAVGRIYLEGGVLAFWVGNGLSVAKIFPESAIKFYSYETSKRLFAKYVDNVEDSRNISGLSRFLSGGIGGITSQLSIYPIETLKTQMMSSAGNQKMTLVEASRHLWSLGGMRAYYRGLTVGLIGVFPYAAIDMSTFEALKLAYLKSTGKEEPGVLPTLMFGSVSGGVGATSVYPMNLVRTRLQASGSSGHPERYSGVWDVTVKTYQREGWRGYYRGLFPTLAKVIPSVSISYVVYEYSKKRLGV